MKKKIEHSTKANMAPFFIPLAIAVIVAIAGVIMIVVNSVNSYVFGIIALIAAGLILIFSLTKLEYLLSTKIYVTNKKVILKSGVFKSVQSELLLDSLREITIVEPLLGRLFHYGTVVVESSASTVGVRAQNIDKPYDIKKTLKIEQR